MHQSGHSRAHSMHDVQFSSISAMTPRLRRGKLWFDVGILLGDRPRVIDLRSRPSPLSRPTPSSAPVASAFVVSVPHHATVTTPVTTSCASAIGIKSARPASAAGQPAAADNSPAPRSRRTQERRPSRTSRATSRRSGRATHRETARSQEAQQDDPGVLGKQEKGEAQARVLGVGPKMISASATGISNGGRLSSASPATKNTTAAGSCQMQPPRLPRVDDAGEPHRPSRHHHRCRSQDERQLVRHQLRHLSHGSEHRVLVCARPAGHQGPDDPDPMTRARRRLLRRAPDRPDRANRDRHHHHEVRDQRDGRRQPKRPLVRRSWGDRLPSARTSRRQPPAVPTRETHRRTWDPPGPACGPSPCARAAPRAAAASRKRRRR